MSQSKHGLRDTLRLTTRFLEGNRRAVVFVVVAAVISGFAEAIVLVTIARLAFALANSSGDVTFSLGPLGNVTVAMETLLAIAAGLVVIDVLLQLAGARVRSRLGARVNRKYRSQLVQLYIGASWSLQSSERSGRLQEMVSAFVGTASSAVSQFANGLVALASLIAFLVTAFVVNIIAAIAVALAAVGLAMLLRPMRRKTRTVSEKLARANLVAVTDVAEASAHLQEIRVFNAEGAVSDNISARIEDAARLEARRAFLTSVAPLTYQGIALFLIVAAVGILYAADVSRLGAVGGVVLIMLRSLSYGQSLQASYQSLHSAAPHLEVLANELDRYRAAGVRRDGRAIEAIGELEFEKVSFEYEPGVPVLRDVTFSVPHGQIIGIVGPSGSGKSTLVQLVLRFREPIEGRVLVDGEDVTTLDLDDWYQRVSFVPQDPALFAGSIADNIRFYREGLDDAAVERAARLANLHDEIAALPLGYDAPVGERGSQLSGGQRQRLCIARALADEPDLIVFDESTSALDVRSESLVREAMAGMAPRATVLVIAHRLSTLSICDRIMVLLNGELQGFDEPKQLEDSNPFYREALELSGLR